MDSLTCACTGFKQDSRGGYSTSGVVHHGSAPYGAVDPDIAVGLALLDLEAKGCPVRKLFQAYNIKIPEGVYP